MDIENKTWTSEEMLFPGMWVYRDVFNNFSIIEKMEDFLNNNSSKYTWKTATVGYIQENLDYRNCLDFKLGEIENPKNTDQMFLNLMWKNLYNLQSSAANRYCDRYNIKMNYWEVMNLIKYGNGQHFKEHSDHGYSYSATVSLVGYLNDDYEGGELYFPKLDINIKPRKGDLYIFPSTYLFSHVAKEVKSGTKYSLVTMLDYNNHAHNNEFMQMRERLINSDKNRSV